MTNYQTIVLGSSPDALTAATYLARAGQKVLVLEPSKHIGGAVDTQPFAEGFQADIGLISGRLNAEVIADLKLDKHGLEVIERNSISSLLPDGRSFTLPADRDSATTTIGKFAPEDATRYIRLMELLDVAADLLHSAYASTSPQFFHPTALDTAQLQTLSSKLQSYGKRQMTEVMRLLVMSSRDFLDEWFENKDLKGLLASACVRGLSQGPFAAGTTFNLLHHLALGDGYFRATAKGGIGAISRALASAAQAAGAEIRTDIGLPQVVISNGTATGVQCKNGETINAENVISSYDAHCTFRQLVTPSELEPEFNRSLQHVRYNGCVARVNLALRALPKISGLTAESLQGTLVVSPAVAYLEKAYDAAKRGSLSAKPYLEVTIPTLVDPGLAPAGQHVMSVWVQYAPYRGNIKPAAIKEAALAALTEVIPELASLIRHSQVLTPEDFESQLQLTEGHLYGGDMTLYQSLFMRPVPGFAQYRTPIDKLLLCGPATHPGGGISGLSGKHVAHELGARNLALSSK